MRVRAFKLRIGTDSYQAGVISLFAHKLKGGRNLLTMYGLKREKKEKATLMHIKG